MRNDQDFEKLVFERAEEIKARDRKLRVIRTSLMPLAAAFVVLTAVGIHGAFSSNTTQNMADTPYTDYEERQFTNNTKDDKAKENTYNFADDIAAEQNDDIAVIPEDAAEAENIEPAQESEASDITALTFISNEKNIYTDADTIGQISEILKREPSENAFESKGYRGKIEATSSGGKVTQYIVYSDHLTKEGTQSVTIALTENDLTLLTQLFS